MFLGQEFLAHGIVILLLAMLLHSRQYANTLYAYSRFHGLTFYASHHVAILGLTILAVGNSVADWVADTVVAKYGKVEMAFASCFGSPLMSHVLGLSIALIVSFNYWNDLSVLCSGMQKFLLMYTRVGP